MRKRHSPRRVTKHTTPGPVKTFEIEGLTHEAKGVARFQGKVTFIEGALPGEKVEAQIHKFGRRFDEATLTRTLSASPDRVEPFCPHFSECGGCSFQHLSSPKQLEAKKNWLQGQLRNVLDTQDITLLHDRDVAYRRRARLSIQVKNNQVLLGFRSKSSQSITSIEQCAVLSQGLQTAYSALRKRVLQDAIASKLGHIELLEDAKGKSVLFRLTAPVKQEIREDWSMWAREENLTLYWQDDNVARAKVEVDQLRHYTLENESLFLEYHPQDFIQVNARMNDKMVSQAMEWLAPDAEDVVLDLFCGVGNFSLPLGKRAKKVLGVEVQEGMVVAGRHNAQRNHLDNVHFLAADLTKPVSTEFSGMGVTKILLDPPRAGAFEFLESITKIKPRQILYVSCNASTLARDAEYLVAKGYRILRVGLMDMFPQTSHVEAMMLLQKKK